MALYGNTKKREKAMFPPGIEPGTFRVLGGCDNHYTTETVEGVIQLTLIRLEFGQGSVNPATPRKLSSKTGRKLHTRNTKYVNRQVWPRGGGGQVFSSDDDRICEMQNNGCTGTH